MIQQHHFLEDNIIPSQSSPQARRSTLILLGMAAEQQVPSLVTVLGRDGLFLARNIPSGVYKQLMDSVLILSVYHTSHKRKPTVGYQNVVVPYIVIVGEPSQCI